MTRTAVLTLAGLTGVAAMLAVSTASPARQVPVTTVDTPSVQDRLPRPFAIGERATYDVKYLFASGSGSMEVGAIDTVRGRDAYRFSFVLNASIPWFKIRDTLQSWVDTASFNSLRFTQDQHEGSKNRQRRYEVFPDRAVYTDRGRPEQPSVPDPLDDVSFLYFVRGLDLKVGAHHEFGRYFKPESNPVKLTVLRQETITVPLGRFKTIVVQPIIKAGGLFGEKGQALMWLTDDSARMIVQVKIDMPIVGTLTLALKSYQPALIPPPRRP